LLLAIVLVVMTTLPVFSATTGSITGTFSINAPPSVTTVTLTDTAMTPQSSYTVTVDVSDPDSIDDVTQLVLKVWHDTDNATISESEFNAATADAQEAAVFTWTKNGQSAAPPVLTPGGTTWSLDSYTVPSNVPHFNGASFQWSFTFTVGKVATETTGSDSWQIGAVVTDSASSTDFNYDATDASMNWYGEISGLSGVSVDWGTITSGIDFGDAGAQQAVAATVNYLANGAYNEKVKSSGTWAGSSYTANLDSGGTTNNPSVDNEFAIKANNTATLSSAALVDTTGVVIDTSGTQTTESGDSATANNLWIKLDSTFDADTYDGTITYIIANGS
jgi:hypothetical protein